MPALVSRTVIGRCCSWMWRPPRRRVPNQKHLVEVVRSSDETGPAPRRRRVDRSPPSSFGQYAPFPYGDATLPPGWQPVCENPTYLIVPTCFFEEVRDDEEYGARQDDQLVLMPPTLAPTRCNLLCKILGSLSIFAYEMVALSMFALSFPREFVRELSAGRPDGGIVTVFLIWLIFSIYAYVVMVKLNLSFSSLIFPSVISLGELPGFLRRRVETAPPVVFTCVPGERAHGRQRGVRNGTSIDPTGQGFCRDRRLWSYDDCDRVSSQLLEDVVDQIAALTELNPTVLLAITAKVELVGDKTRGQFMTDLHQFYLDGCFAKRIWIGVDWEATNGGQGFEDSIVVTRTGQLPLKYRVFRFALVTSAYFHLFFILFPFGLLFFPRALASPFRLRYKIRLIVRA